MGPHTANNILETLIKFENTVLIKNKLINFRQKAFYICLPWYVEKKFFYQEMFRKTVNMSVIPGLQAKHFLRLLCLAFLNRNQMNSVAYAIQLKMDMSRLRAFYSENEASAPLSVKIVKLPHDQQIFQIPNEIKQRRLIEKLGTITIPRIISSGHMDGYSYIVEDHIKGRRFRYRQDQKILVTKAIPELIATYKKAGITEESVCDYFSETALVQLNKIAQSNPDISNLAHYMQQAIQKKSVLDTGLCHGDLVPSNLCYSQQKIYFLDWELSKHGPIIPDILHIALRYPHKCDFILSGIYKNLVDQGLIKNIGLGFSLVIAQQIIKSPAKREALIRLWKRHHQQWLVSSEKKQGLRN